MIVPAGLAPLHISGSMQDNEDIVVELTSDREVCTHYSFLVVRPVELAAHVHGEQIDRKSVV